MKWTNGNKRSLIQYLTAQDMPTNIIAKLMSYTYKYIDRETLTVKQVTDNMDELYECAMCGCIEHSKHMIDTEGTVGGSIGVVCVDCIEDMEDF